MDALAAESLCSRWLAAWTGNRPIALLAFYAEDCFYRDPFVPGGLSGHSMLRPYLEKILAKNPKWTWTARELLPTADGFVIKWLAKVPMGAQSLEEEGLDIVQVNDRGKISRNEAYFDASRWRAAIYKTARR